MSSIKKHTAKMSFELKDVKEPVLYREVFPYTSVPRVVLEERLIQTNIPRGHLDHGHDVPRRAAVPAALHAPADRGYLRFHAPHERTQGSDPPDRVFPLFREGPRSGAPLQGAGLPLSGDHGLDPGEQEGLRAREGDGVEGDRHPHLLLGLPYFPQAEHVAQRGAQAVLRHRRDRAGAGHHSPLPSRGHHPRRLLRLRHPLRAGTDEAVGTGADAR